LLALHFSAVFLYSGLFIKNERANYLLQWYVYPYFQQNWTLFAPAPHNNYHLYARCKEKVMEDIFASLINAHRHNRLAGNEAAMTAFLHYIHFFETGTMQKNAVNKIRDDKNFDMLRLAAGKYLHCPGQDADSVKIILVVRDIRGSHARVYFN
jgi:hypothetical protein